MLSDIDTEDLRLADDTVVATIDVFTDDGVPTCVMIGEWTSRQPGQGHTNRALQELRDRYPLARLVAHDAETLQAEAYWLHQLALGRVDGVTDAEGEPLG